MTNEESGTENNKEVLPIEEVVDEKAQQENEGLSLEDAISAAHKELTSREETKETPTLDKVTEEATPAREAATLTEEPPLNAPAEFTPDEKADFLGSSRKQQEAALRLYQSSRKRFNDIHEAAREYQHVKKIAESITPILKARGLKESPEVIMQKSAELWQLFEYAEDPKKAAAQYLLAKGVQPPEEWLNGTAAPHPSDEKIRALQERQEQLERAYAQKASEEYTANALQHFNLFAQTQNASGKPKYPDLQGDSGTQRAAKIGRLVNGLTPNSNEFIQEAQSRIPDLTPQKLLEEAYRFYGGKIDDSPAKKQSAETHLTKAKRAASSRPGGVYGPRTISNDRNKYADTSSAIEAAWRDLNSDN